MSAAAAPGRFRALGLAAATVVLGLDQIIKYVVTHRLELANPLADAIRLTPFFSLTWTQNYGVSMGFLRADTELMRWLLVAMLICISGFVSWWLWRERNRDDAFALAATALDGQYAANLVNLTYAVCAPALAALLARKAANERQVMASSLVAFINIHNL